MALRDGEIRRETMRTWASAAGGYRSYELRQIAADAFEFHVRVDGGYRDKPAILSRSDLHAVSRLFAEVVYETGGKVT